LTANINEQATANLVGGLTIGSSGAPISINGVTFPPNPALVSSTDDVDWGEYGYNATEYEYNATEYEYNATEYEYNATEYEYNATEYEYKATDYEYNVTEYVYEYEDNGIMQKLNAAGIGN